MPIFETVPLDRINIHDRRFCVSYPAGNPLLLASIGEVGIIAPVLLMGSAPFTIVTGFKRVLAAALLGLPGVPAIVGSDLSEREAVLFAIHDNLVRGMNLVEKGLALDRMLTLGFSTEEVHGVMRLLGLSPHERLLATLVAVAYAEEALKAFIVSRSLSVRNIEGLLRFEASERERLLVVLSSIHTTEGYLREILSMAAIMRLREGRIYFDVFSEITDADDLRRRLKRRIHPMLSALEERRDRVRREAMLPPHVDIKIDPFFEKEYIDIDIRAFSVKDVESALVRLRRALEDGTLGSMLELTKG
jgi:ParB-like chromosome segregation protein Spo0J